MCIAIVKPAGVDVSEETLSICWRSNPDGAGYAFVEDGKVVIRKGYMKLKDFLKAYEEDKAKDSPFLIHFRITSQGSKDEFNTHPFSIKDGAAIHNGTLDGTGAEYGKGPSDTKIFLRQFGDWLTYDNVEKYKKELGDAIRTSNKIAMLFSDKRYQILNESMGNWHEGAWYSNYTYRNYSGTRGDHNYAASCGYNWTD